MSGPKEINPSYGKGYEAAIADVPSPVEETKTDDITTEQMKEVKKASAKFIEEMERKAGVAFQFADRNYRERQEKIIPKLPESLKNKSIIYGPAILVPSVLTYQIHKNLEGINYPNKNTAEEKIKNV